MIGLIRSFKYAFCGFFFCVRTCRNFRIHTVAAALVLFVNTFFERTAAETALIMLTIALVLTAEAFNCAMEQMCDAVTVERDTHIKHAKDAAAAAVLSIALFSAAIGVVMFWNADSLLSAWRAVTATPLRIALLIVAVIAAAVYIFYEDIFCHGKKRD